METAESHLTAAEEQLRQGHARSALDEARAALRVQPESGRVYAMMALAYTLMGEEDDARDAMKKAAELAPRDSTVRYHLYLAHCRMRDLTGARAELTYFCQLEVKNEQARAALAHLGGPMTDIPPLPAAQRAAVWYDGTGHAVTEGDDFDADLASDDAEPPPGPDVVTCPNCQKRTWKGWFCKHCGGGLSAG